MTGRGIDQILPHASDPRLFESYVKSALGYVELAERESGPIARPVDFSSVGGDALTELERAAPDARIVNLETAVTASDDAWPSKGIHYRMHPANVPCLSAAGIDCCVLANNHVMDWGRSGLEETLATLHRAGLRTAGAGLDLAEAAAPATLELVDGARVLVFAFATASSGVPSSWAAGRRRSGVNFLEDLSERRVHEVAAAVRHHRRDSDIVIASIHWGPNWGYAVSRSERAFAHGLIEAADVDIVHGHSSHHAKGIEVYRDRLILYGCGDFLNDYEGIGGYEEYRGDLALMYFATLEPGDGRLRGLAMTATRVRRFRIERAGREDAEWLRGALSREGANLGTRLELRPDGTLALAWPSMDARAARGAFM
jgi:poly-gamma-glutamate synthesis protein (capsule biosynthesis protein)